MCSYQKMHVGSSSFSGALAQVASWLHLYWAGKGYLWCVMGPAAAPARERKWRSGAVDQGDGDTRLIALPHSPHPPQPLFSPTSPHCSRISPTPPPCFSHVTHLTTLLNPPIPAHHIIFPTVFHCLTNWLHSSNHISSSSRHHRPAIPHFSHCIKACG